MLKALDDSDYCVSAAAAEALGEIGDTRAVRPLVAVLRVTKWYKGIEVKRKAAAKALGEIGDTRAVDPLIAALKDEYYSVHKVAAEALGKLEDPRAVEPLIAALKSNSWDMRKATAKALISLYRSVNLSDEHKQRILEMKPKITQEHKDYHTDRGCGSSHQDKGIGIRFGL